MPLPAILFYVVSYGDSEHLIYLFARRENRQNKVREKRNTFILNDCVAETSYECAYTLPCLHRTHTQSHTATCTLV